jgi:ATP-dependent Lon protease
MFITTANWGDTIPGPLLDRMEVIQLSGYTVSEKIAIAKGYLIDRQLRENGLRASDVVFEDEALARIIHDYSREAGVRNLEREIGRVCRKLATRVADGESGTRVVTAEAVAEFLGRPRFFGPEEIQERTSLPGVATGLAFTPVGGEVLFIEATAIPGRNQLIQTGSLGQVMQESARAALSYVRGASSRLKVPEDFWKDRDLHLHIPAGAQPKDGPSAGVTIATALASLATGRPVRHDVAMTGEVTLRGKVLPIGGVKEKVLAAHRAGLKAVILPRRNEGDLEDVPQEVRDTIRFVFVDTIDDVLEAALEPRRAKRDRRTRSVAAGRRRRPKN